MKYILSDIKFEVLGNCFICGRMITREGDFQDNKTTYYFSKWPGDGLACKKHKGVCELYDEEIKKLEVELIKQRIENSISLIAVMRGDKS